MDRGYRFIPVHLEYIFTEILKNAFRASVEHHFALHGQYSTIPVPPVTITISPPPPHWQAVSADLSAPLEPLDARPLHLSIRMRDQGGGVSAANMSRIFSYAFTTATKKDDDGGPYATQQVGGAAAMDGNLFGEITSKGLQTGMGTIAGLGYGLPMSRLYARLVLLTATFLWHMDAENTSGISEDL